MYLTTKDEKYLLAAISAGEAMWKLGLLKKSLSLCHGVVGNMYVPVN